MASMKDVLMQQYPQGGMGGRINTNDPPSSQKNLVGERGIAYSNPIDGGYDFNPLRQYANPITGYQENLSAQALMNSLIDDTAPPLTNPMPVLKEGFSNPYSKDNLLEREPGGGGFVNPYTEDNPLEREPQAFVNPYFNNFSTEQENANLEDSRNAVMAKYKKRF